MILKRNKFWFIQFLFCFLIMILFFLQAYQIPKLSFRWITDAEYRMNYRIHCDIQPCNVHDLFSLWEELVTIMPLEFRRANAVSTGIFQFMIPFIGASAAVVFYKRYTTISKLEMTRSKSIGSFLLKEMFMIACKTGLAVLLAYTLLFVVMKCVTLPIGTDEAGRSFLVDLLKEGFCRNHPYFHDYLDGVVRFFYMPFVYSMFAQCIALWCTQVREVVLISCIWYFGLVIIGFALYGVLGEYYIYFSPIVIMANGDFNHINSLLMLLSASLPLLIGLGSFVYRVKNDEY